MSQEEIPLNQFQRLVAGRPACLLTVRYKGQVNVMTLSWVSPVSSEPPLLGMAIHPSSYTHDMFKRSQECVINIPGRPLAEQVVQCGSVSGQQEDKLALTHLQLDNGRRVQAPWISECLAHLECSVVGTVAPGDHTLFVVEVVGIWAESGAFANGFWLLPDDAEELHPLIHLGDTSFALLGKKITVAAKPNEGN
jgi:flavin reductase (DIM6/NTAB) family NADH-FMN oxidoreductase RutF